MKNVTEVKALIDGQPAGKLTALRSEKDFIQVRRNDAGFEVECGWVVPEAHDDDYMSHSQHPFKGGRQQPWVGRAAQCTTSADAAEVYVRWRDLMLAHSGSQIRDGVKIGSVVR